MKLNEEGKGNELSDYPEFHQQGCEEIRELNKKKGEEGILLFVWLWQARRREGEREREERKRERERNFVVMALIGLLEKVWFRVW